MKFLPLIAGFLFQVNGFCVYEPKPKPYYIHKKPISEGKHLPKQSQKDNVQIQGEVVFDNRKPDNHAKNECIRKANDDLDLCLRSKDIIYDDDLTEKKDRLHGVIPLIG